MSRSSSDIESKPDETPPGSDALASGEASGIPRSLRAAAWFVRACAFVVLGIGLLNFLYFSKSKDPWTFRNLMEIVRATMLFLLSFALVTKGRAKVFFVVGAVLSAFMVIAYSVAQLVLRHS